MKALSIPAFLAAGFAMVVSLTPTFAQNQTEAAQIQDELRQLKKDYEERIRQLEERLRKMEAAQATNAPATNATAVALDGSSTNAISARDFARREFLRDTESRERDAVFDQGPFRERVEQVLQDFVEVHGYVRAGYGRDNKGGPQVAFQAPGALSKYRLGNEAETYGELTFGKNFYVPGLFKLDPPPRADGLPSGPIARVQTTISYYNPYQDLLSSGNTDFGIPEAWASIGNVFEAQPSMKFWAGYRFYRRHDIHISDFFFYNMSGAGGGVEDVETPFGKLALAWIGAASSSGVSDVPEPDAENKAGFSKANWDLRLYDVPLPLGRGEFGIVYARADSGLDASGNSAPNTEGVSFNFLHTRDRFLSEDGINKFSLQFGTGPALTFTSGFDTVTLTNGVFIQPEDDSSWRFRVTEHFTASLSEHFAIGPALVYQLTDYADMEGKVQWFSAGVRPIWYLNKYISLAFEGGVDWVRDDNANTSAPLYKLTLAPQVSLGHRFMSRPVIRGFVTYAHWGKAFEGQVGGNDYANDTEGLTFGVQMEAWW